MCLVFWQNENSKIPERFHLPSFSFLPNFFFFRSEHLKKNISQFYAFFLERCFFLDKSNP